MSLGKNKKSYLIVLDKSVKNKIDKIAILEGRSSSNLINFLLKKYIESREDREGES